MSEEEMRKKIIIEMIIDKLFYSLAKDSKGVEINTYKIDEQEMTYLLKKYDSNKFAEYEKMLKGDNNNG